MLKAYTDLLIARLVTLGFLAGSPVRSDMIAELRAKGFEFEDALGMKGLTS